MFSVSMGGKTAVHVETVSFKNIIEGIVAGTKALPEAKSHVASQCAAVTLRIPNGGFAQASKDLFRHHPPLLPLLLIEASDSNVRATLPKQV